MFFIDNDKSLTSTEGTTLESTSAEALTSQADVLTTTGNIFFNHSGKICYENLLSILPTIKTCNSFSNVISSESLSIDTTTNEVTQSTSKAVLDGSGNGDLVNTGNIIGIN